MREKPIPAAPKFVIVKTRDGRWLMSAASLARIPKPGFAKRMADRLPPWFRSEFLGLEVWQLLGVLVLIFLALTVQKTTVFIIRTYFKRWVQASRIGLLNKAVSKADRPIGGLVMAAVFYLGFPALLFPLRISQIAMLATQALAAYSFVWLAYRLIDIFAEWLAAKAEGTDTKKLKRDAEKEIESLRTSARGRHVAMWMRDPDLQSAVADVGLAGELSETRHDYLAVFNQNTNRSKADFWQERSVASEVRLREDGSAKVRLTISVHNDSSPYTQTYADPRGGSYVTRWNGMTLGVFLPEGAEVTSATAAGKPQGTRVFDYYGRPYKLLRLTLPPGATREAVLEYDVPAAAVAPGGRQHVGEEGAVASLARTPARQHGSRQANRYEHEDGANQDQAGVRGRVRHRAEDYGCQ